jgi:hypothetical protein
MDAEIRNAFFIFLCIKKCFLVRFAQQITISKDGRDSISRSIKDMVKDCLLTHQGPQPGEASQILDPCLDHQHRRLMLQYMHAALYPPH